MFNLLMLLAGAGSDAGAVVEEPGRELATTPTYIDFMPLGPLYAKEGDTAPIVFRLRGAGGVAQRLTGSVEVRWTVVRPGYPPIIDDEVVSIVDVDDGRVSYTPGPDELVGGRYRVEATATWSDSASRRFPTRGYGEAVIESALE